MTIADYIWNIWNSKKKYYIEPISSTKKIKLTNNRLMQYILLIKKIKKKLKYMYMVWFGLNWF
jgi:hypothetical protein